HPYVALYRSYVPSVLIDQGELGRAVAGFEAIIPVLEERFGAASSMVSGALNNLGIAYHRLGKGRESARVHERARAIIEKSPQPSAPDLVMALGGIGYGQIDAGRPDLAIAP